MYNVAQEFRLKAALVSALVACASERQRRDARRFLQGLSCDELQYIAGFLGACILEGAPADALADGERLSPGIHLDDHEHKLVLALEYLGRCGAGVRCRAAAV